MKFALVAGEASGDILGGALIAALRRRFPGATFTGVAGPRMREAGCEAVESIDALSVMGLAEVVKHLPRLLKLRDALVERFVREKPDAYIGIDAPDFNLRVETALKARGVRTVHMVSPTIWAWRPGRVHGIGRAADLILCLYPFEPALYGKHGIRAAYMGHPLADELDARVTQADARRALGIPDEGPVVAVLPGSRGSELHYLSEPFAAAAAWLHARMAGLRFVTPIARPDLKPVFERALARHPGPAFQLLDGQSRLAMQAADAVLLASGTATLECLLLGRAMVVGYKVSKSTAFLARRLVKIPQVSLPNILGTAGLSKAVLGEEALVPELLQQDATPERLGQELFMLLRHPVLRQQQLAQFDAVRARGRRDRATAGRVKPMGEGAVTYVAGADEVGRGALAGPVYAAAVILPERPRLRGLDDSKKLTRLQRERMVPRIEQRAICWAIASASLEEIERLNILHASLLAMQRAVEALAHAPGALRVDGIHAPQVRCPVETVVGGDGSVPAIMAASIIAKVARDAEMRRLDAQFPGYGFAEHKGYATPEHLAALQALGPCAIHRKLFAPVAQMSLLLEVA